MREIHQKMRIAYAIQNVGGIDFSQDVGDTVPVKQSLFGLREKGYDVSCFRLSGRKVLGFKNVLEHTDTWETPLGLSGTRPFMAIESMVRRIQRELHLSYYAFFDSFRFYEACLRTLPEYALCHEHNGMFSVGAALACKRLNIPYILTFSADPLMELEFVGSPLSGFHARVAAAEARFTYSLARKILCVSEAAKSHLINNWRVPGEKIVVMPNGVDSNLFHPNYCGEEIRKKIGINEGPVIAFVGGFQPWHGLENLIKSLVQVLPEFPSTQLLLIGDGEIRPELEKLINKFGLGSSVTITGFVPQDRVAEYLAAVDVAVVPYPKLPNELWFSPLKLYEYMASGRAIVASNEGQIAEVINDGENGVLVEPGDVNVLAQAMITLLRDPEKREKLGTNARQQAVEQHSWGQYVQRLIGIYESVLK